MSTAEAKQSLDELHELEKQIAHVGVPLSYMEEYYNLRLHLNLVYSQVDAILNQADPTDRSPFARGQAPEHCAQAQSCAGMMDRQFSLVRRIFAVEVASLT